MNNVSLTNDLVFTHIFGTLKNISFLEYLLECYYNKPDGYFENQLTATFEKTLETDKKTRKRVKLDIVVQYKNKVINIEMYSKFTKRAFQKSAYYIVLLGNEQVLRGKDYQAMDKIEQINFVQKVSGVKLSRELKQSLTKYPLTEVMEMAIVNLDKLDKVGYNHNVNKKFLQLLQFMVAKNEKERLKFAEGKEVLMRMNAAIEEYLNSEEYLSKFDFFKGREEIKYYDGFDDGQERKQIEIARSMLKEKCKIELIAKVTKLSVDEIQKLKQES